MSNDRRQCGARRMAGNDENAGSSSGSDMLQTLGIGIGVVGLAALAGYGIAALLRSNDVQESPRIEYVQEEYRPMVTNSFLNRNITQDECAICQDPLCGMCGGIQQEIVQLVCGHIFHSDCIRPWLQQGARNCPTCRERHVSAQVVNDKCKEKRSEQE